MPRGMMKGMGGRMMGSMMDPRSRVLMALSGGQRLRIIEMLKSGEKRLADLRDRIDVSVLSMFK